MTQAMSRSVTVSVTVSVARARARARATPQHDGLLNYLLKVKKIAQKAEKTKTKKKRSQAQITKIVSKYSISTTDSQAATKATAYLNPSTTNAGKILHPLHHGALP